MKRHYTVYCPDSSSSSYNRLENAQVEADRRGGYVVDNRLLQQENIVYKAATI